MGFCYSTALQPTHADPQCSLVPNFTHCKLISGSFPSLFPSPTLSLLIQQASRSTSQSLLFCEKQETKTPEVLPCHQRTEAKSHGPAAQHNQTMVWDPLGGRQLPWLQPTGLSQSPRFSVLSHPFWQLASYNTTYLHAMLPNQGKKVLFPHYKPET